MDTAQPPARTQLFTVRMWLEDLGAGQAEWRGELHHVVSGETRYFHRVDAGDAAGAGRWRWAGAHDHGTSNIDEGQ
jgi:hypothetical protein